MAVWYRKQEWKSAETPRRCPATDAIIQVGLGVSLEFPDVWATEIYVLGGNATFKGQTLQYYIPSLSNPPEITIAGDGNPSIGSKRQTIRWWHESLKQMQYEVKVWMKSNSVYWIYFYCQIQHVIMPVFAYCNGSIAWLSDFYKCYHYWCCTNLY